MASYWGWWLVILLQGVVQAQELDLTEKMALEFFTSNRIHSYQAVEVNLPADEGEQAEYLTSKQIQEQELQQDDFKQAQRRRRWQETMDTTTLQVQEVIEILRL